MRRRVALAALMVFVLSAAFPAEATAQEQRFESRLESIVPDLLWRYEVPSAAIAVVRDGRVVWSRRFDRKGADRSGDVFKVASLSKSATALAVLALSERGRIDLDAPLDRYLERWKVPPSRFGESGVTARRLLSHTAGFPVGGIARPPAARYPSVESVLEGRHNIVPVRLVAEPGTTFLYSNPGYVVLELLLEEVSGMSFPEAMQQLVFEPLDMNETGYDDDEGLADREERGYQRAGIRRQVGPLVPRAPGGMISTPSDIGRLLIGVSLPKERGGLLQRHTLRELHAVSKVARGAFGLRDGGYALGVAKMPLPSGRTIVANNGSFEGFNSMMMSAPRQRAGLVVITNSDTGLGPELDLAIEWSDAVVGERPVALRALQGIRTALHFGTLALLLLCIAFLARSAVLIRRGQRAWPGRIKIRALLLRTIPLLGISVAVVLVFERRASGNGIPPARFVSASFQWTAALLALSLAAIGALALARPKRKDAAES